jgi:Domain of unknown function (DUF4157)
MDGALRVQASSLARPAAKFMPTGARLLQRCGDGTCGCGCEEGHDEDLLLRLPSATAGPPHAPSIVHDVLASPGLPLEPPTRDEMERSFGHDFGRVRVHADARADASARAVSAVAYTVGSDVVFAAGQYAPATGPGRRLLAHELTHVVQHSGSSEAMGPSIRLGPADGPLEAEADAAGGSDLERKHVSGRHAPLLQRRMVVTPADVPLPPGVQGPPTPFTFAVQGLMADTCPEGRLTMDIRTGAVSDPTSFCEPPAPDGGGKRAATSRTPVGCGCLCDVIRSAQTLTIAFSPGGPGTSPGAVAAAGRQPGQGGQAISPTVSADPRFQGQYQIGGRWVDIPFHLIFAHEVCGHALPKMRGTHAARGPTPAGGTPPSERHAVDAERAIAAEHSPPLPRRPEDYSGAARQRP